MVNVNETPSALNLTADVFNENIAAGSSVATLSSIDLDGGNTFTYSLVSGTGSNDNAAFSISADKLKITASPDFETKSSYAIRLRTTDQGGLSFDRSIILAVADVNEKPTALNISTTGFSENIAAANVIALLSSLDPDAANTYTYGLVAGNGSIDNAAFSISGNQLKIIASPDFETRNSYSIRLRTTDQGGLSFDRELTLAVSDVNESPYALNLSATIFDENIAADNAIASLSSLDPDFGSTYTYSLVAGPGSTDNAAFRIAGDLGDLLKINASPDFETKNSYAIRLRTTDQGGLSFERQLILTVANLNEAPTTLNLSAFDFIENIATDSAVATLSSLDPDANTIFTYSLVPGPGSTDNAAFSISGDKLKIIASPDYELKRAYAIRLRATDQGGLFFDCVVTLTVGDLNEAPTDIIPSVSGFNENISAGSFVATLSSLDADANNTHTYSLVSGNGDTHNEAFLVVGDQLQITASPDFESQSSYAIRLRSIDQAGLSFERWLSLAVVNLNETPSALNLSADVFSENIAAGSTVATLSSIDLDSGSTFSYSLVSGIGGNDNAAFSISGDQLKINVSPDFEAKSSYAIRLRTTDQGGLSLDRDITLVVADVNEKPTALDLSVSSFYENIAAGNAVASLSSLDPDTANTYIHSLVPGNGSTDNSAFTISGNQLKINFSPDFEVKTSYNIRLRTTDQGGLSFDREFLLAVINVNESPLALNLSTTNFDENIAADNAIASLSSLDLDIGSTFTYSLVAGPGSTDNSAFRIAGDLGDLLMINTSPDFEARKSYAIRLRTTDQGGLFFDRSVILTVADLNEAPTALNLSATVFNENISPGSVVALLSSLDPDASNTYAYSLISGTGSADNAAFSISDNQLKIISSPDYEVKKSYAIRLRTTDQGGLFFDRALTLTVGDLNEAPTALNLSVSSFTENITPGSAIATLSSLDADVNNSFSYGLVTGAGSSDNLAFTISDDQLRITASPDYEAKRSYAIRLRSTDQGGLFFDRELTLSVTNVNESPTALNLSAVSFNENVSSGSIVSSLSTLDPDLGNAFGYALVAGAGSRDNQAFSILNNQLRINSSPDFETSSAYFIRLRTTDQGGLSFEREVMLAVADINENPTALNISVANFNENIAAGSAIVLLSSLDPDNGNTYSYALVAGNGSTDNAAFTISANQLKINASPDFEVKNSYAIRLRTTDQGGLSYDRELSLAVLDVNETPFALNLSTTVFNENIAADNAIASLATLDSDVGSTFTYSLVAGAGSTDNTAFRIAGDLGDLLKINSSPDFEAKNSYSIRLRTTDQGGLSFERQLTLTVANLNEAPTALNLSSLSLNENIAPGSVVAALTSLDPDASNTYVYSLVSGAGSADNAAFSIFGDQLKVISSPDFEAKNSYGIRLRTTDQGGLSFERQLTLTVANVNEAPTALNPSVSSFSENIAAGSAVAALFSLDPDASNSHTYDLVSGAGSLDNAAFSISGDQLKINSSPDFEQKNNYSIRLRSTDQGLLSFEKAFSFSVIDVFEPVDLTIESLGLTVLTRLSSGLYVTQRREQGSIDSPIRKDGTQIYDGIYGREWQVLAAEQINGINQVLWKNISANKLHVWSLDSAWNWQSSAGWDDPLSAVGQQLEVDFGLDLDANGKVASPITKVEFAGFTSLLKGFSNEYSIQVNTAGSISVPVIKDGVQIYTGIYGGDWQVLAAESVNGVNQVLWKNTSANRLHVWSLDSSWNWSSSAGWDEPSSAVGQQLEADFGLDLDGNGTFATPTTKLESTGLISLLMGSGNKYSIQSSAVGSTPVALFKDGVQIYKGIYGLDWQVLAAETINGTNQVLWRNTSANKLHVWFLDSNWAWTRSAGWDDPSSTIGQQLEASFGIDLDGNRIVASPETRIESAGRISLIQKWTNSAYSVQSIAAASSPVAITKEGVQVYAGIYGNDWQLLAAETINGTNQVLWKNTFANRLHVWSLDGSWNWQSSTGWDEPTSTVGQQLEASFGIDLDGNGSIASTSTTFMSVETAGSIILLKGYNTFKGLRNKYSVQSSLPGSVAQDILNNGGQIYEGIYGNEWNILAAETINGVNQVLWNNTLLNRLHVWTLDANWNRTSSGGLIDPLTGAGMELEAQFGLDANADGIIHFYRPGNSAVDQITGTTADEFFAPSGVGIIGVDRIITGGGRNQIQLQDINGSNLYANSGEADLLVIEGFDSTRDQLLVEANKAYGTTALSISAGAGLGLYEDRNGDGKYGKFDELLAVLKGTNGLPASSLVLG